MNDHNKISIIGGSGFLGSRLQKVLINSDYEIKILDQKDLPGVDQAVDVTKIRSLDVLNQSGVIINLAAVHRDDIRPLSLYDDVNVKGAENICEAANKFGINKIIFTSSVAIYGFAEPGTDESGEVNYFNDYGRTKYLAEVVYKNWQMQDPENRTLVIIRPTVIFGEGNRGNVFNLLNQIAKRRFVMFGNGENIKSMAYVENVASFIKYCLGFDNGIHIYNYIDKPDLNMNMLISIARKSLFGKKNVGLRLPKILGISIGFFADLVSKIIGRNLPISSIRVKKFMSTTQFSSSIMNTDFIAPISLEEGLQRTLKYEFLEDNSHERTFETE